jgi:hypothetical protein
MIGGLERYSDKGSGGSAQGCPGKFRLQADCVRSPCWDKGQGEVVLRGLVPRIHVFVAGVKGSG